MGPHLELFKFSVYLFFPIATMLHYGDPGWYDKYVYPYKDAWVRPELAEKKPPRDESELQSELARLKTERLARREARLRSEGQGHHQEGAVGEGDGGLRKLGAEGGSVDGRLV